MVILRLLIAGGRRWGSRGTPHPPRALRVGYRVVAVAMQSQTSDLIVVGQIPPGCSPRAEGNGSLADEENLSWLLEGFDALNDAHVKSLRLEYSDNTPLRRAVLNDISNRHEPGFDLRHLAKGTLKTTRPGNSSLASSTPRPRIRQFDPRNPTPSHDSDTLPSGFSIYTLIGTYVSALVGQKCAQAGSPPHKSHLITC